MSDTAVLERVGEELSQLRSAVMLMARQKGTRLTRAQVCERIGRCSKTLTVMVRRGDFPSPADDGRWLLSEILEWESRR